GYPDDPLAVGQDEGFVGHQVGQVFPDGFPDLLLVALLVHLAFAVQGPVLPGNEEALPGHGSPLLFSVFPGTGSPGPPRVSEAPWGNRLTVEQAAGVPQQSVGAHLAVAVVFDE